jgi:alcohol dehydrogenase, propanol-preferring
MRAMVLQRFDSALVSEERSVPAPDRGQIRIKVKACGVCRTDLHVVAGELADPTLPIVPGHEIVGVVDAVGEATTRRVGERVGVPWLGFADGTCEYCLSGHENLCDAARFTGFQIDGGYAEYVIADERFCLNLPARVDDLHAAPLLCAGLIGYRCLSKAGDAHRLGLYGFGASAHIIAQIARHQGREVYAFVRHGDDKAAEFARSLGAVWAGPSDEASPRPLDAAIIFAPLGELVPRALRSLRKGGRVVCGGIHMTPIPRFPYEWLWGEREIVSVANLTRSDGAEFMRLVEQVRVSVHVQRYALADAQEALEDLRAGRFSGAAVLVP